MPRIAAERRLRRDDRLVLCVLPGFEANAPPDGAFPGLVCHVACRKDVRIRRAPLVVHDDPVPDFQSRFAGQFDVGYDADADEHRVRRELRPVSKHCDDPASRRAPQRFEAGFEA
ncbi:MAG: hypothetical protein HC807_00255, partial [Gammaproteobacteria bacterium]|nr:hypothetical protein [Gammaproteobacteria bacterium]